MNTTKSPTRIPSYRLHKATGQAIVTLDGRDHYLGEHGSEDSRQRYARLIAEWTANGYRLPDRSQHLTIVELAAAYWRHAQGYYVKNGESTAESYNIKGALKPLKKLYGSTLARDFGPLELKTVRQAMIDADLSRKVINDRVNIIRRVFKWAVAEGMIPPSVLHGLQAVDGLKRGRTAARETTPVQPVPEAHIEAVRPHVSRQIWAMIELQQLTAMRSGEVTIMRGCDLDTSGKVWIYTPAAHKTEHHGHARKIFVGPRAQAIIRPFLKPDVTAYLFSPADADAERQAERRRNRRSPMTPSQQKRSDRAQRRAERGERKRPPRDHYKPQSYGYAIRRACIKAEIPSWHPHQLRHNAATWLRKEFGIEVARIVLGHRSPAITEVYAELDAAKAQEIIG
ncbi:MAG: tyrosine-type recombinase/integrase, partial [Planctomycetota bacterium]|nr:tyrosine-type recombinase/integrase [Planctomycetota bacterium]